jgi:hypothetical protein
MVIGTIGAKDGLSKTCCDKGGAKEQFSLYDWSARVQGASDVERTARQDIRCGAP